MGVEAGSNSVPTMLNKAAASTSAAEAVTHVATTTSNVAAESTLGVEAGSNSVQTMLNVAAASTLAV